MQDFAVEFLKNRKVAVAGASPSGKKFGNYIYKTLRDKGYQVFPVHPTAEAIESDRAYRDFSDLPDDVTSALFAIRPERAVTLIKSAARGGIKRIWFQRGADFSEAAARAKKAGLEVATGRCLLMYAQPVTGIHAVHRLLVKTFGKL